MKNRGWALLPLCLFFACTNQPANQSRNGVKYSGAMKTTVRQGQLQGTIDLDTIADKQHLYGIGPVEYLTGELTVFDGKSYKSTVLNDTAMLVEETFKARAPFFVYANVSEWTETALPAEVKTLPQLEEYLDETTKNAPRPFAFLLKGMVEKATIHIVNLPPSSHEEAHQGLRQYPLEKTACEILGFFSTEHKAIFTHHDTFMHLHLLTQDHQKMGHLEDVEFEAGGVRLFLPK